MKYNWQRAFLILLLIEFFVFRSNIFGMGLYLDDWLDVYAVSKTGSLWGTVRALAGMGLHLKRPLTILLLAPIHHLIDPLKFTGLWMPQLIFGALETSAAFLLFLLMSRLLQNIRLAFAIAVFALLYPNRAATHFWISMIGQPFAHILVLASLLFHLNWTEHEKNRDLLIGQLLYGAALLFYESVMLAPLLLGGALAGLWSKQGKKWPEIAGKLTRSFWPYAVSLGLVLTWQWVGYNLFVEAASHQSQLLAPSAATALKNLLAGFGCTMPWPVSLCVIRFFDALREFSGWSWLALLLGAALISRKLSFLDGGTGESPALDRVLGGAILGAFIGSYLPYLLSDAYMPYVNGIMSRVNSTSAWPGGMILAGALLLLSRFCSKYRVPRQLPRAFLGLIVAAFIWTNWLEASAWRNAWRLQSDILQRLGSNVKDLPDHPLVVLTGV
ncbi:MAG: hypothetical protein ABL955_09180, partial [Elusimicrobiota bacterium]